MLTTSWEIARRRGLRCPDMRKDVKPMEMHTHTTLIGRKAKFGQVYPREPCRTVCAGIAAQKRVEKLRVVDMPILSLQDMHG